MTEHIGQNLFKEKHVILEWKGDWYKLPFYLLEDIKPLCHGLGKWIYIQDIKQDPASIPELKEILSNQMPLMVAYKMENNE